MDKIKSKLWYSKRKEEKIKQNRRKLGNEKETLAASFLIQQGFELLERNFSCQSGEIDLILREGIELVVTEVEYRSVLFPPNLVENPCFTNPNSERAGKDIYGACPVISKTESSFNLLSKRL